MTASELSKLIPSSIRTARRLSPLAAFAAVFALSAGAEAQLLKGTPVSDSSNLQDKQVVAVCPTGFVAVGVETKLNNNFAIITTATPLGGTGVLAKASGFVDGGYTLTANAVCAPTPAGLTLVTATTTTGPGVATGVACSPFQALVGGGFVGSVSSMPVLTAPLYDTSGLARGWQYAARQVGTRATATGFAVALCANAPLNGSIRKEVTRSTAAIGGNDIFGTSPACPGSQRAAFGGFMDAWGLFNSIRGSSLTTNAAFTGSARLNATQNIYYTAVCVNP